MPRRASVTGDRRSRIHRQVAKYHAAIVPFAVPWSGRERYCCTQDRCLAIANSQTVGIRRNNCIRDARRWPEPGASTDRDDVCERHRPPTKQGTQASPIGLPLADTRIATEIRPTNCILPDCQQRSCPSVLLLLYDQSDRLHEA